MERQESDFMKWYRKNAERYNENRKRKYHEDAEYRKRAKECALHTYRKMHGIHPDGSRGVYYAGKKYRAVKLSIAEERLGLPSGSLRRYLVDGVLPYMPFEGMKLRMLTIDQIKLLDSVLPEDRSSFAKMRDFIRENSHLIYPKWGDNYESNKAG